MTDQIRRVKRSMWRVVEDEGQDGAPLHIESPVEVMETHCGKSLVGAMVIVGTTGEVRVCGRCYRKEFGP